MLLSEHRAAAASRPVYLELVAEQAESTHLAVIGDVGSEKREDLGERVLEVLSAGGVLTRASLRQMLAVKNERLGDALESLQEAGRIRRTATGWQRIP